ncbi:MAG: RsmD family RNA methyltransferase [Aminivibrio sp.]
MKESRPTTGKVLGALFNILGDLRGRSFLDMFSGTGRVARLARDRGACHVTAVELVPSRAKEIRALFPGDGGAVVLAMDARRALDYLRRKGRLFDVVFADPPYGAGWTAEIGQLLFPPGGGVVAEGGIAVVEHSSREALPGGPGWVIVESRRYGDASLTFLASRGGEEEE